MSDQRIFETKFFNLAESEKPFVFESGEELDSAVIAYETYGELSPSRDNAVLLFHALSGSQHAAGYNPEVPGVGKLWAVECQVGWWDDFIGPGKALDTDRYFVICANYIGGCYGSTGPRSINPETNQHYGSSFPAVSTADIIKSQIALLDYLKVECLHAVLGASLGGMLSLELALLFPNRVKRIIPIASGVEVTVLQRILNLEQIGAIESDSNYRRGDYYSGEPPSQGLALARMISHKTFISLSVLEQRASEEIVSADEFFSSYKITHPIESYMLHQGQKFTRRFDANTYVLIMEAWQQFNLRKYCDGCQLGNFFKKLKDHSFLVFSIDSDVCFYPEEQAWQVQLLKEGGAQVQHITVHSEKGHDAFLLEAEHFAPYLSYFLGK